MPRVKRGVNTLKKRRKIMKAAKGFRGARSRRFKCAREATLHSLAYGYSDRRKKKRDFRSLWIIRINAAARMNGLSYNRFMEGLKKAGIKINRKILADIAVSDQQVFSDYVSLAKGSLK